MKLPKYEKAVIAESKILKYLLDETHPRGKDKATFFIHFGFIKAEWDKLAKALLEHAAVHEIASTLMTSEGIHYAVDGDLQTPDKRDPQLRSIWAIDRGSEIPRFITAYPLEKPEEGQEE